MIWLQENPTVATTLGITQKQILQFNIKNAEDLNSLAGYEKFTINPEGTQLQNIVAYKSPVTGKLIPAGSHLTDVHFPGEENEMGPYNFGMVNPRFPVRTKIGSTSEAEQGAILLGAKNSVYTPQGTLTGKIILGPDISRPNDV